MYICPTVPRKEGMPGPLSSRSSDYLDIFVLNNKILFQEVLPASEDLTHVSFRCLLWLLGKAGKRGDKKIPILFLFKKSLKLTSGILLFYTIWLYGCVYLN